MPTSTPRLSEVARHLVLPSGITRTGWPAVEARLGDLGVAFDPWQAQVCQCALGKRDDGSYAAGIGGVLLSVCRQAGKTYMLCGLVFALCLLTPGLTVMWTAHRLRTAGETFRAMQAFARRRLVAPQVLQVRQGAGDQVVLLRNGSRVLFGARERGFGRGFARVDVVVLDEAQILTESALEDMVPATNQSANPLVVMTGTPPRPGDPADVFTARRAEALAGASDDTLYVEFSADPGVDPAGWQGAVDWEQVAKANPSYPRRTSRAAVQRMLVQLGPAAFRREGLGIWDEVVVRESVIGKGRWRGLVSAPPDGGVVGFGVKVTTDGDRVAVGACRLVDGVAFVEAFEPQPFPDAVEAVVAWLVPRLRAGAAVWLDGKAGAGLLVEQLRRKRAPMRRVVAPTVDQVVTAHAAFLERVTSGSLGHSDQPGLTAAVLAAGRRPIGARGGWGWKALGDGDVAPLDAVTLAVAAVDGAQRGARQRGRGVVLAW